MHYISIGENTNTTDSTNSTEKNSTAVKQEKKPKIEIFKEEISKQEMVLDFEDLSGDAQKASQKRYVIEKIGKLKGSILT